MSDNPKKEKCMKRQPLFIAFSNQKGGMGKSAFTVLVAGYFHYQKGQNVLVVDCDYPQFSIRSMRERDKQVVEKKNSYKQLMIAQYERIQKKAYTVLAARPEEAKETADRFLEESGMEYDLVFFDLPGTVNSDGVFRSIINMDHLFVPITMDRMVMQSSLSFAATLKDFLSTHPDAPLKGLHLFWNKVDKRVSKELFHLYTEIMERLCLDVLQTVIPDTQRYSKELSQTGKMFFRSTLFPPPESLLKDSGLVELVDEIVQITSK